MGKKKRKRTRHHIVNKTNGGDARISNILIIYRDKHDVWHRLFRNLDLRQAARLLLRVARMKERQAFND